MLHHSLARRGVKALGPGWVLMLGLLVANAADAEPRVALVIGNSAYKGDLPALPNPSNDAKLMARTLKSVGFDVVEAEDASQDEMKRAIAAFSDKLTAAGSEGTGLFFYAGHGVQVAGENYLIPVDAKIKREADVDLVAVSATTVLKQMEFANSAVNIIILDACRNNPLGDGGRSLGRGLAKIESAARQFHRLFDRTGLDRGGRRRREQPLHQGPGRDHHRARPLHRRRVPGSAHQGAGFDRQ